MKFNDLINESGFLKANHTSKEFLDFKKSIENLLNSCKDFSLQEKQSLQVVMLKTLNDRFLK